MRTLIIMLLCLLLAGCGSSQRSAGEVAKQKESDSSAEQAAEDPSPQDGDSEPATDSSFDSSGASEPEEPLAEREESVSYRPSDNRPKRDAEALKELGIRRYASKHLELYTDIPPEKAQPLPGLVDQLYADLEEYFGPLPPDREGATFQMTGYIMADRRVFQETGLLPNDLRVFNHGRHRETEFWMNDQKFDYYRRHLMLHEATHCFMTITRQEFNLPPVWYMEGMAELFGTHRIGEGGEAAFRVMPDDKETFAGLGRISLVKTAIEDGRFRTLDQVFALTANDFGKDEAYAWSWAVCKFLDTHPRYRERFRELGDAPTGRNFLRRFQETFKADADDLRTAWALFAHDLDEGYQIEPAAVTFEAGKPLNETSPQAEVKIQADRGWQSSGVLVEQGQQYTLTATGQFTLAQKPKPWVSEADGISFRYFGGEPLGKLLGCIRTDTPRSIATAHSMRQVFPCGARHTFTAPQTGTLYLRLNDAWNQLDDNRGEVTLQIRLD